jgi:hypothetical protein
VNDQLMAVMLRRLPEGGGLLHQALALGEAIPGRHLQRFRDTRHRQPVGVYTQNGNGNKLDAFQQRTVRETVRLRSDG